MSFIRYRTELYDRPTASLDLKPRMVKSEVVEALLYGCAAVRDRGWGGMENCGIRSRQVVGNGDGGGPNVYGHMEEGGGESN